LIILNKTKQTGAFSFILFTTTSSNLRTSSISEYDLLLSSPDVLNLGISESLLVGDLYFESLFSNLAFEMVNSSILDSNSSV